MLPILISTEARSCLRNILELTLSYPLTKQKPSAFENILIKISTRVVASLLAVYLFDVLVKRYEFVISMYSLVGIVIFAVYALKFYR